MARTTKAGHPGPAPLPLWRLLAVSAVALTTANCAQNTQKFAAGSPGGSSRDPKYGVKASPRLYEEGDVIPKGGGRRFSGKPYVVAGRTYVPREDAKGYVREGLASWYGSAFHGRMTANGEVFDRHSIAAAHPTLPLPSYARVTNLANGHSMIVRVNDRGPYHANRVMDVSEEVAEALEFRRSGTARVRVEYAGKASTAGSDDRKLLATLRTDGQPAAIRGQAPVMLADLGPDAPQVSSERLARASRPALAFRQAGESEAGEETVAAIGEAPEATPRPVRPAPVLVASAATLAVPAALQPTAVRAEAFRPVRHSPSENPPAMAQAAPRATPLSLTPPPLRLAGARPDPARSEAGAGRFAAAPASLKAMQPVRAVAGTEIRPPAGVRLAAASPMVPARAAAPSHAAATPPAPRLPGKATAGPAPKAMLARLASDAAAPSVSGAKGMATRVAVAAKAPVNVKPSVTAKAAITTTPTQVAKAGARSRAQFAEVR